MVLAHGCPKAVKVKPLSGYRIQVSFSNGRVVIYDVKQDINRIKAFHKLRAESEFQKVYVAYAGASIAWGDGNPFSDPDMDVEVPYTEGDIVLHEVS
ncbi:DUF2442 domain-containing protein [Streptococcus ferus]|uniref:DUF2442 domain-containing protein n=1 Tax=Streptococcus ferus TaxID=1345 RepID=UPI002355127D|nr:DUF2442 domain-containing protein [Streptococcus ferus]